MCDRAIREELQKCDAADAAASLTRFGVKWRKNAIALHQSIQSSMFLNKIVKPS